MIKVYSKNREFIEQTNKYRDMKIERGLNQLDLLFFNVPKQLGYLFEEEGYIETKDHGRFVIKEKNLGQGIEIVGKYDLEDLDEWVESKSYVTENIIEIGEDLLEGTGWELLYGNKEGRNLILGSGIEREFDEDIETTVEYYDEFERKDYPWGRNLLTFDEFSPWGEGYKRDGYLFTLKSGRKGIRVGNSKISPLIDYTLSFQTLKISGDVTAIGGHYAGTSGMCYIDGIYRGPGFLINYPNDDLPHHIVYAFNVREGYDDWLYIQPNRSHYGLEYEMDIWDIKLEKGSQATPWTPAPEDFNNLKGKQYNLSTTLKKDQWYTLSVEGAFVEDDFVGVWLGSDKFIGYLDEDNKITFKADEQFDDDYIIVKSLSEEGAINKIWLTEGEKQYEYQPNQSDLTLAKRTVTATNMSVLSTLKKAIETFNYDIKFDNINKKIYVADELGSDKGVYFHSELNLRRINISSDSHDFATRLIPVGFDGMGIESINEGKPYVENHSYSNKIKTVYWKDERYTVPENLKEDAIRKLEELAKPRKSYSCDVVNLAKASKDKYSILDYDIGDVITLVDKETGTKEKQRIVKLVHFPDDPLQDTVEIENRPRYLGQREREEIDNLREGFNTTRASLELLKDGVFARVEEIEGTVEEITDEMDERFGETEASIERNRAELEIISDEISTKVSQTEYDEGYDEINQNLTEFKQSFEDFKLGVTVGGGDNLIKNSVGYGGLNYWELITGEVESTHNNTWILEGIAKHGWIISHGEITQIIDLIPNTGYTLSGKYAKQTPQGSVFIGLHDVETEELIEEIINDVEEFDGEFTHNFTLEDIRQVVLKIKVENASEVNPVLITDLMLAQGENYNYWSQAMGESYTMNVRIDGEGITVYNQDGQGKTVMSPEEFAGYYNNRKIFTLNGDITEVMGLMIKEKGLYIPPVKFVQTNDSLDIVWTGSDV